MRLINSLIPIWTLGTQMAWVTTRIILVVKHGKKEKHHHHTPNMFSVLLPTVNPSYTCSRSTSVSTHCFPSVTVVLLMQQLFEGRPCQKCISFVSSEVFERSGGIFGHHGTHQRFGNFGSVRHLLTYHDCGLRWVRKTSGDNLSIITYITPFDHALTTSSGFSSTPEYIARADILEDTHRLGQSKPLLTYQRYFKSAWKKLVDAPASGRKYITSIEEWSCNCGQQKYHPQHLCKHLVQAVSPPPLIFW